MPRTARAGVNQSATEWKTGFDSRQGHGFFSLSHRLDLLWAHPACNHIGTGDSFIGDKAAGM